MTVHIALIGRSREPVLKGFRHYGGIECLYLLHGPNTPEFKFKSLAEEVRDQLGRIGFHGTSLSQIDPFDMHSVIDTILGIVDKEKSPIYINITGGTNLMAGAACAAAYFVGAQAYYVQGRSDKPEAEGKILELPVPNIPYYRVLDKTQLLILKKLSQRGNPMPNSLLREETEMSPQNLSYHIKQLERKKLVEVGRGTERNARGGGNEPVDRRAITIRLTNAGRLAEAWANLRK